MHHEISNWLLHLSSKSSHLLYAVSVHVTPWTGWQQFYLWWDRCQLHPSPNWLIPTVFPQWAGPLLVGFRTQWLHQWSRHRLGSHTEADKGEGERRRTAILQHRLTHAHPLPHTHSLHSASSDAGESAYGWDYAQTSLIEREMKL